MFSSSVNFSWRSRVFPAVALAVTSFFLRACEPQLAAEKESAGGILGGMRAVVAGGFWLRTNLAWERCDSEETMAFLKFTVAADGEPRYFWLNGARMIAYDIPEWRSTLDMPAALRRQLGREQAHVALDFLADGLRVHQDDAELLIEMANIRLRVLDDREGAALLLREAARRPGAPYFAARIYAELLVQLGRPADALAWLQQVLPGLPASDPAARREVVVQRIKALEAQMDAR